MLIEVIKGEWRTALLQGMSQVVFKLSMYRAAPPAGHPKVKYSVALALSTSTSFSGVSTLGTILASLFLSPSSGFLAHIAHS